MFEPTHHKEPMLEEGPFGIKRHPSKQVYADYFADLEKANHWEEDEDKNKNKNKDKDMISLLVSFLQSFVFDKKEEAEEEAEKAKQERIRKVIEFHKQQFIYDDFACTTEMV